MKNTHTEFETYKHIATRSTNALLAIEALGYKVQSVIDSNSSPEAKLECLSGLNHDILKRVMEGTITSFRMNA